MKFIKVWYRTIRIGMLSTVKKLNFRQKVSFFCSFVLGKTMSEFKINGGTKYPDKKFFVIRRDSTDVGLFSIFNTNVGYIKYALDRDYIPVIDMQHYDNCYLNNNELGKINAWDLFFEQITDLPLDEVYKAKNLVLSSVIPLDNRPNDHMSYFNNENNELDMWRSVVQNTIKVKNDLINEAKTRFFNDSKMSRVLGVSIRGTDYIKLEPPNHPVQPTAERVIKDAKKIMKESNCEKIYLCTEDVGIIRQFIEEFKDLCFTNKRDLFDYKEGSIINKKRKANINRHSDGEEYLITIYMLGLCDVLLASRASGTVASELLSEGWERKVIYNLGRYPEKKEN